MFIVEVKIRATNELLANYECEEYEKERSIIDGIYFNPDEYILTLISPIEEQEPTEEEGIEEE